MLHEYYTFVIFALEATKKYSTVKVSIIHDVSNEEKTVLHSYILNCGFPHEFPDSVADIFDEKAITYLQGLGYSLLIRLDYSKEVANHIIQHVKRQSESQTEKKFVNLQNQLNCKVFIGHRRLTGQAIAGQ